MHRSALAGIIIDCNDLKGAAAFWGGALGLEVVEDGEQYVFLGGGPGGISVGLQRVPEEKTAKTRVHLDIVTDDLDGEVQRLEGLGATRQSNTEGWWVLQDPCGNEFCVVPSGSGELPEHARSWE
jgi:catechol 2,3-dioxygenase-like lactoylglutathione lyase family enzyme